MAIILTDDQHYSDIADAIRDKNNTDNTYTPAEMAPAILEIPTGSGVDVSDTTAVAGDVASGKYFYTADGVKTAGTYIPLVYIDRVHDQTWKLSETAYNGWTPSTTAKAIITGAATQKTFVATDIATHPYYIRSLMEVNCVYPDGTSHAKGELLKVVGANWYTVNRRSSNLTNTQSETLNTGIATALNNVWCLLYYSSATAQTFTWSQSYGFYQANVAPTFSSATAASPTITVKYPTVNARVSATYFASAFATAIDQEESTIRIVTDVWRAVDGFEINSSYKAIAHAWNYGLNSHDL